MSLLDLRFAATWTVHARRLAVKALVIALSLLAGCVDRPYKPCGSCRAVMIGGAIVIGCDCQAQPQPVVPSCEKGKETP